MSDTECAGSIRLQYLGQLQPGGDLPAGLLHRIAADITGQCGVSPLKAHRLAWGWTVSEAVEAFHRMCRREMIKPRGLTRRSWMDWEAGDRPGWDYQDLVSRLFSTSPVRLGWAADYAADPTASRDRSLAVSGARTFADASVVVQDHADHDSRRGRSLLQLPPDIRDFTGRAEQVGQVSRLITAAVVSAQTALPIVCVSGQPGAGKTTLAIHVAHKIGGDFPDGQLYASLRGADARVQDPADVLAGFLRELGVDGAHIPEGTDERARMYRAHLADQRILVVLDNAANEAQVRPLLPGSPGCAVLVTSRSPLAALAGSHSISLDVLPPDQAADLLTAIIGADRAGAEPDAVDEIGRLCGYLPLALRIAGARLVSRPAWKISWFASRLRDASRRLDLLRAGDLEVRASFALSYDGRDPAEQRAFRMLGLLAADFAAWNLAALLGTDADEAEWLLEQLADAELIDIAGVDAAGLIRYRLHDLLRDFARERLQDEEALDARQEALARLADEYIGAARLASALVHPGAPDSTAQPEARLLAGEVVRGDPWAWLSAERAGLVAITGEAHAAGLRDRTWQLAETLPALCDWRADWRSWEHTHRLALDAARDEKDTAAEARILRSLGVLYRELGRYDEAVTLLRQAARIFDSHSSQHQWAAAMRNLGDAYRYQGRLTAALDAFTASLAVFRQEADARSAAGALNGLADACRGLSRWDESGSAFRDCIGIYQDLGDRLEEARAKIRFALLYRDQHLNGQAVPLITEGLRVVRELGDRRWEARAIRQLAIAHRNRGDTDTAITGFGDCLAIFRELEDRRGAAVVLRNRGDAFRLAGRLDDAAADLADALDAFQAIGDRRWTARTLIGIAGLCRLRQQWAAARGHLNISLATFRDIGDRPAEARTLRELGILFREQGDLSSAADALNASQEIFTGLGDALWTARVLAGKAALAGLADSDPASLMRQAEDICRQHGITAGHDIASALREW